MVKSPTDARVALARGAFAGLAAGLVLTLMMTVMSAASGKDVCYGIKGAAAPFLHDRAMQPGFDFGVNVASLGLMALVTVQLGRSAIVDAVTAGLAVASAVLLLRFKVNSTMVDRRWSNCRYFSGGLAVRIGAPDGIESEAHRA